MYFVQVVSTSREFGGREEGGWWYDLVNVHFQKRMPKRLAIKLARKLAVEVSEDVSGEVMLCIPNRDTQMIQEAYKGRNRYSVLGGDDWTVQVTKHPSETTTARPRYE